MRNIKIEGDTREDLICTIEIDRKDLNILQRAVLLYLNTHKAHQISTNHIMKMHHDKIAEINEDLNQIEVGFMEYFN